MIYLDYNATSPIRPGVRAAMDALGDAPLNTSSVHAMGRVAKKHLEDARATIASALSAFPNEVLFTSSATEANNMVMRGFAGTHTLLVSAVEHASISKTAGLLGGAVIPVDANGVVKLDALEDMLAALGGDAGFSPPPAGEATRLSDTLGALSRSLSAEALAKADGEGAMNGTEPHLHAPLSSPPRKGEGTSPASPSSINSKRPVLISVMLANNETGVIQPITEVVRIARKHKALVHCDAVQGIGKLPMDWGLLGVDMLTITGHKAGGPVGSAALLIRNDLPIKPLLTGGGQELGRRAGTDNIRAIVGFAQAVKEVASCADVVQWLQWREWLAAELLGAAPDAVVIGANAARLPNTLCITIPGVKSETQLMNFDLAGFAVSAGSACSSGRIGISPALQAMGLAPEVAECALRISWGWATTKAEIEAFAAAWKQVAQRLSKQQLAG